jgi:hypothetical protein
MLTGKWFDLLFTGQSKPGPEWPLSDYQKQALKSFNESVEKDLKGATVWVFGSAGRGRALPFSDVDVAVVSPKFAGMPWVERIKQLKLLCSKGSPISPIGVTDEELSRPDQAYPSVLRSLTAGQRKSADELVKG